MKSLWVASIFLATWVGGAAAQETVELMDNAPRFDAQATFPGAIQAEDGTKFDLRVQFLTDSAGEVTAPVLQVVTDGEVSALGGYCEPICITYGNPKRKRCFFPSGCGSAGGDNPVLLPVLRDSPPVVLEFETQSLGNNSVALTVDLWKNEESTPLQTKGILDFSKLEVEK